MANKEYIVNRQKADVVKWLRQNGERGVDWEFWGGLNAVHIFIYNEKLETAYILQWDWAGVAEK